MSACVSTNVQLNASDGSWSGVSDCYSSSNFSITGGMVGVMLYNGDATVDDYKLWSYNSGNSSYDILEHVDDFAIDGSGYATDTLTYDANGNLTYDGTSAYTYDAWNRMKTVAHAYRDGGGVHSGQVYDTTSY